MATFDRFDICEAYAALETDWNVGGILQERPSCQRRNESVGVQLHRIGFRTGACFNGFESLSENGKDIYLEAAQRMGLPADVCTDCGNVVNSGSKCACCNNTEEG